MDIKQALGELDHKNDDHWTADGQPKLEALAQIMGVEKVTRKEVIDADPKFRREEDKPEPAPEPKPKDLMPEIEAMTEQYQEMLRAKGKLEEEIAELSFKIEQLSIQHERQTYKRPGEKLQSQITAYLRTQQAVRAAKAEARAKFQAALGNVQGDVIAELDVRSPLDSAMKQKGRKAKRA